MCKASPELMDPAMTLRHDGVSRPKPKTPEMLFRSLRQRPAPLESLGGQCSGSSRPNCSASELYYPDNGMKQMRQGSGRAGALGGC